MTYHRHRLPINLFKVLDLCLIVASFGLSTAVIVHADHKLTLLAFLSMRTRTINFLIFMFALILCHVIFQMFGLYHSQRLSSKRSEVADVVKAVTLSTACLLVFGLLYSIRMFTPQFLVTLWILTAAIVATSRFVLRAGLERVRAHGRNLRYILILGTNTRAVEFARELQSNPESGYRLAGFVDDDWHGMAMFKESGFRVVSDFDGLAEFLRRNVVDEAVVYLPFGSLYRLWSEFARLFADHGIIVRLNSDSLGLSNAMWRQEDVDGSHYIATRTGAGEGWPLVAKRALDILFSAVLLLLFAPFLVVVAIAIKLTSAGDVFFLQQRVGLNKRRFKIIKFRTMVPDAERLIAALETKNEVDGPAFKIKNDPRITPIGRFLRRTSIDELPQLINVLKGDMSLVGPRPLPVRDYEGFCEDWQRRRFSVKPGITCLWQVNGRNGIPFKQWMELDLQYIDEWSLWLDMKILLRTVPTVVRGTGAA